jgi:PDZ domain-containing protein
VLYDRNSDSVWYPMSDETIDAVAGSQRGTSLPILAEPAPRPLGEWLAEHPDTEVLLPTEEEAQALARMAAMPYLGVQFDERTAGLFIDTVRPEAPAARAMLEDGDRVIAIDGIPIDSRREFREAMSHHVAGETVVVTIARHSSVMHLEVTLGSRADAR